MRQHVGPTAVRLARDVAPLDVRGDLPDDVRYSLSTDLDQESIKRFARVVGIYHDGKFSNPLTPREQEIAYLTVVEGMTNGELAKRFAISVKTISVQRVHIAVKLGFELRSHEMWHTLARDYWIAVGREHGGE